ncbi:hypothetical protein ACPOLB_25680 [Rubrivivax sp. RP6-9]|uniref:hypothetical protein n=1 Tax=Rubrivivax sp. RP6-9 TaxID=3415750 RepID=UPI003CC58105
MQTFFSSGGWLPLWILGAPLLAGVFALFATPKSSRSTSTSTLRDDRRPSGAMDARPT